MPNTITEETPQRTKHKTGFQKTYASVGTNNANAEKESQTLLKKLKTLNPNKQPQRRKNSPDGPTSKIRQEPSPRDEEIENQITNFKTVSNQQHYWEQSKERKDGLHSRSPDHKKYRTNNVLNFMQQTMETLSAYNKQLNLDINLTHQETL